MALVVQKFGGSSLSDLERLGGVADWVTARRNAGDSLAIVVSAMGKTTEGLLSLARDAARARPGFEPPRRELDMLVSTGERVRRSNEHHPEAFERCRRQRPRGTGRDSHRRRHTGRWSGPLLYRRPGRVRILVSPITRSGR